MNFNALSDKGFSDQNWNTLLDFPFGVSYKSILSLFEFFHSLIRFLGPINKALYENILLFDQITKFLNSSLNYIDVPAIPMKNRKVIHKVKRININFPLLHF